MIKYLENVVFWILLNFNNFLQARNALVIFAEKPQRKFNSLNEQEHRYLIYT